MLRPIAKQKSPRMEPAGKSVAIQHMEMMGDLTDWGLERVGCTEHDTSSLDRVKPLPHHGDNWASSHVLDQAGEKALALEIGVI
jgi:hypothetical protein